MKNARLRTASLTPNSALAAVDDLGRFVTIAAVVFPTVNALYRWSRGRKITRGAVVEKSLAGASAVPALFLLLSPFDTTLLPPVADQPLFLIPAAVITLLVTIGSVFDWND